MHHFGAVPIKVMIGRCLSERSVECIFLVFFLFDEILKVFIRVVNFLKKMYIDC